jgi:hypothetical protein
VRVAADAELAANPRATFRRLLYGLSGDNTHGDLPVNPLVRPRTGILDLFEDPDRLPGWLTDSDIDTLAAEFGESGVHRRPQLVSQLRP